MRAVIIGHGDPFIKNPYLSKLSLVLERAGVAYTFWVWSRDKGYQPRKNVSVIFRYGRWGGGVLGYVMWMVILFSKALFADKNTVYFCSRLDAALPFAFANVVKRSKYVFLDRDRMSKSYAWNRILKKIIEEIEEFTARRSTLHIVPGQSRAMAGSKNLRIVRNTPHKAVMERAEVLARALPEKVKPLRVLISGLISPERGAEWMLDVVQHLKDDAIEFICAGRLLGGFAKSLAGQPNVTYLGILSNEAALAWTIQSDLVLAFYDPAIEINRLAEPNKWFDCAALNVAFVSNSGLETLYEFEQRNACFVCEYGETKQLTHLLRSLIGDSRHMLEKSENLKKMHFVPWDEAMTEAISDVVHPK